MEEGAWEWRGRECTRSLTCTPARAARLLASILSSSSGLSAWADYLTVVANEGESLRLWQAVQALRRVPEQSRCVHARLSARARLRAAMSVASGSPTHTRAQPLSVAGHRGVRAAHRAVPPAADHACGQETAAETVRRRGARSAAGREGLRRGCVRAVGAASVCALGCDYSPTPPHSPRLPPARAVERAVELTWASSVLHPFLSHQMGVRWEEYPRRKAAAITLERVGRG